MGMVNLPAGCAGCHKLGIGYAACRGCGLHYCSSCSARFSGRCQNCGGQLF